jgi:hypothetical protein
MTLTRSRQCDMTADALRINRQDITELVRNCRWVVEYRKNRPDVVAEYLRVLRSLSEAQERASALGMGECRLAAPLAPLPIRRDEYHWAELLERFAPKPAPINRFRPKSEQAAVAA